MDKLTKVKLADEIIKVLALSSVLSVALFAPNAVKIFDKPTQILLKKLDERERQRLIGEAMSHLKYRKLISENYKHGLILTNAAHRRLARINIYNLQLSIPRKWDKKWRLVFFDIPESRRRLRKLFTNKLQILGFHILQQSVYIYPYECREDIITVAEYYNIAKYITYVEVMYIDNDKTLRQHFGIQ